MSTSTVYSYTKLIAGNSCAMNGLYLMLDRKGMTAEDKKSIHNQIDYLKDENRRYSLNRLVCGDQMVTVR